MNKEILLALISKMVEERLNSLSSSHRGLRGRPGPAGQDGKDFVFEEHADKIKGLVEESALTFDKLTDEQKESLRGLAGEQGPAGQDGKDFVFEEHADKIKAFSEDLALTFDKLTDEQKESLRGPRGPEGREGKSGKDFNFEEHSETIKAFAKEFAITFDKLSPEEIESLRGPQGLEGKEGKSGKDFDFEEHSEKIKSWVEELALTFDKLTSEQKEELRGPRGRDGKDGINGQDFNFENVRDEVSQIIFNYIEGKNEDYKLKFSDLTDEDRESIRGPRGRDGRDGKGFVFDEHREFFQGLKPKFSDFTEEEKEELKLRFTHLTTEEKASLKLRFSDLTDEDRAEIRGPRGVRGQRGPIGQIGPEGPRGLRGLPGAEGPVGRPGIGIAGKDGRDGRDGQDAPYITEIQVDKNRSDEIDFTFYFSDGTRLVTNSVKLPMSNNTFIAGGGGDGGSGGGGGGSSGSGSLEFFDDGISIGEGTELNFTGLGVYSERVGDRINVNIDGGEAAGVYFDVPCAEDTYDGAIVRMEEIIVTLYMSDWGTMSDVESLSDTGLDSRAVNALADTYENANVIGVIEEKTAINRCTLRLYGVTLANYEGLDVTDEYYLSDVVPGGMEKTADAPTTIGHILLKVGQPFSPTRLLFSKGERLIRG